MKKFLSMILTVVTVFSIGCFTGCDNKPTADNSSHDATVEGTPTPDSEIAEMKKAFKEANVGEYVTFGHYEQDSDNFNGKEDIEWLVLEKEDDKVLVISKYILDYDYNNTLPTMYNTYQTLGWKNCKIRAWINDEFLNKAFNLKEKSLIKDTVNQNELIPLDTKAEQYVANLDTSTTDKVFVLSKTEMEKYFPTDESRRCAVTKYADFKCGVPPASAYTSIMIDDKPAGMYWTRSCNIIERSCNIIENIIFDVNDIKSEFIYLTAEGSYHFNDSVTSLGIRPAMWISTN